MSQKHVLDLHPASALEIETSCFKIQFEIECEKKACRSSHFNSAELPDLPVHTDWICGNIPWRSGTSYVACGLCYKTAEIDSAMHAVQDLKSGTGTAKKRQGSRAARALEAVLITNRFDAALHMVCEMHTENEKKYEETAAVARHNPAVQAAPASVAPVGDCDIRTLVAACNGSVLQCKATMDAAIKSVLACTQVGEKVEALHKDILAIKEFLKMPEGGNGSDLGDRRYTQWITRRRRSLTRSLMSMPSPLPSCVRAL